MNKKNQKLMLIMAIVAVVAAVVLMVVVVVAMKGGAKEGTAMAELQPASDQEGTDVTVVAENTDGEQEPTEVASETVEQSAAGMSVGGDATGTVTSNAMPNANDVASAATNTSASNTTNAVNAATTTTDASAPAGASAVKGLVLTYGTNNSWQKGDVNMFGVDFQITNNSGAQIEGWTLKMEIEGLAEVDGWNGTFTISGTTMTITDAGYNGAIGNGGSVNCGCNLGVKTGSVTVKSATLNGTNCTVVAGKVDPNAQANAQNAQNNQNNQNNNNQNNNNNNNSNNQQAPVDVSAMLTRCADAVQGDDWLHTDGHRILDKNGKEVWLTGVNWFGYNTGTNTFDGLWNSQMAPTVKAIADHGFNLIRVPISAQLLNDWAAGNYPKANYNNAYNTELNSMNSLQIFDYFLSLAEANGLKVMIDIHSAETDAMGHNANMWCTQKVTADQYLAALAWCADRYKNNDTIIAYDLKNEPHGKPYEGKNAAIWNGSKDANNWKYMAERAALTVLGKNPNVLVMVEGTEIYPVDIKANGDYHSQNDADYYFNWWGGNLRGVADYPVQLGQYQNKLVYSPHDYGPTVYEQPWFKGGYSYDSLMKDCWHDNWFYIYETNTAPLLIGEWGGFMTEPNLTWMTHMRKLIKTYHLNHTFWCLNANSGDTGGLLKDDFTTWDNEKYTFVKDVLWQQNGKFVGLDHQIPLGANGITLSAASGLK